MLNRLLSKTLQKFYFEEFFLKVFSWKISFKSPKIRNIFIRWKTIEDFNSLLIYLPDEKVLWADFCVAIWELGSVHIHIWRCIGQVENLKTPDMSSMRSEIFNFYYDIGNKSLYLPRKIKRTTNDNIRKIEKIELKIKKSLTFNINCFYRWIQFNVLPNRDINTEKIYILTALWRRKFRT